MPRDMYCIQLLYYATMVAGVYGDWYIYSYRRGVCVARFDKLGNAKASKG